MATHERPELFTFRIVRKRATWRVETLEDGRWFAAFTGAGDIDAARAFFATAASIEWDDDRRVSGRYTF